MPIVLAGMAATVFGVADFLGGTAARRVPPFVVAMLAQAVGMLGLLAVVLALPGWTASPGSLTWGLLAGISGGIGVPVFYGAMARGPMNVVAPLAALTSAAVPVLAGTLLGERPSASAWVGIVLAVVAGVVVGLSFQPGGGSGSAVPGVLLALFSGACFGGFFVLIAQAAPAAGLWPVAAAKVGGTLVAAAVLAGTWWSRSADRAPGTELPGPGGELGGPGAAVPGGRRSRLAGWRTRLGGVGWRLAVAGGVLDALANVLYLLATHHGQLAVVGAVVALYPASTVLLARLLHGEHIAPVQWIGLALAAPALALVGAG